MSRFHRGAAIAALTAAATLGAATAAGAQDYNRLVVFGDSLSDNGNLSIVTGGAAPSPAQGFVNGRFSTGPVFVELLGFNLGRYAAGAPVTGSIDYAFGGSRTDAVATPGPGMRTQLQAYLGAGGVFGQRDLVSILGGANNIFQALPAAGASASPVAAIDPVARAAANDITFITNATAAAGAGTILVTNLPKLSLTPQFRGTAAAPLADYAVTTFNGVLLTGLQTTAAARPGSNIIMMDLFKIGDTIAANPAQFGITNVTTACNTTTPMCSDPGYFYTDGVHPTALGHRIIARLANDYLYYGDIGSQSALQGETAYRHREDGLDASTERFSGRAPWEAGTAVTVAGSYDKTDTDARGDLPKAESEGWGARIGLESGTDTWRAGLAGHARVSDVDVGTMSFQLQSLGLDAYAGWRSGPMFVTGAVGFANDDFRDLERLTSVAPIVHTGDTGGTSFGGRLQAGYWFDMGGFALSPRVAVAHVSSDIDGYTEQGVAAQYRYLDRTVEATTAEIALRAEGDLGGFGVFVEGGYRDNLDDGSDPVRVGIDNNPAQVLSVNVEDPFGAQVMASAGVTGKWGPVDIDVGYRGRFGDHADSHMGGITLTLVLP